MSVPAFQNNPAEAARQEYELARKHLAHVRRLNYRDREQRDRFIDARERLDQAIAMMRKVGNP